MDESMQKVSFDLPLETTAAIRDAVSRGGYASDSEFVAEVVLVWSKNRAEQDDEFDDLRDVWRKPTQNTAPGVDPNLAFARVNARLHALKSDAA